MSLSTNVQQSGLINAPIEKVWAAVRSLDFKFNKHVVSSVVEAGQNASDVGSTRTISYSDKEKTVEKVRVTELSDAQHFVSWELEHAEPASHVQSAVHTIRLRRVTTTNSTVIEFESDYSRDASNVVLIDSKYKKLDLFKALEAYVNPPKAKAAAKK